MASKGHPHSQLQRAIKTGNAFMALEAARELDHVPLEDALSLCLLLRNDQRRYQKAAARWLARYHAEREDVTLAEIREVADLFAAIPVHGTEPAAELADHFRQRKQHRCADRVRQFAAD
jgi:hypothetical protein